MAQGKPRFYQPTTTRLPSLLVLFLLTLALIGLTELAVRRFPALDAKGIVRTIHEPRPRLVKNARPVPQAASDAQVSSNVRAIPETTPLPTAPPSSIRPEGDQTTMILEGAPPNSAYLPLKDEEADLLFPPPPSASGPIDVVITDVESSPPSSVDQPDDVVIANAVKPSIYLLVVTGKEITLASAAPPAYLPVGAIATSTTPSGAPVSQGGKETGNIAVVVIRPATVDAAPTPSVAAAGPQSAGPEAAVFQTPGSQNGGENVAGSDQSSIPIAGSSPTPRPQTGEMNAATDSIGPSGAVVNGKTFDYATPTTATVPSGKIIVVDPSGAFLPTVLAVLFSIPWYILFTAVQEMEPFYQLADPQGALARDSLCLDYRASLNVVTTLKAGLRGHFVVLWAGICSIAVLALPPLASETVFIGFVGEGRCTATSSRDVCHPQLSVYPVAARAVQGILSLVAVLTICIAITNSRRKSGVYANPLSIAGIATLFQNPTLIDEFRQLDSDGFDSKTLEAQLQGNRYRLDHFQHRDGSTDYGIVRYIEASFYADGTDYNS
ncbi:MAG: hypothetical protein Q9204_003047 [Flavoplaca sp. TL-2023a]